MAQSAQLKVTVLISGNGSNLQALIDASTDPNPTNDTNEPTPARKITNAHINHVISNRKNAFGLQRAQKSNIPTTYHNLVPYKKLQPDTEEGITKARGEYDKDLAELILSKKPDLVVCAGWMHILSAAFIDKLKEHEIPIINLHPALPGQFNGADAIHRAYGAFQRGEITETGVMIHHVISEVDMGEPVLVEEVKCRVEELESELETRIHAVEWVLIVDATAKVLKEIEDKRKGT